MGHCPMRMGINPEPNGLTQHLACRRVTFCTPWTGGGFDMSVVLSGVFVAQIVGWALLGLFLLLAGVRRGGPSGRWPLHALERNRLARRHPDLTARPLP